MKKKVRVGRFAVSDELLKTDDAKELALLLGGMKILRSEPSFSIYGVTEFLAEFSEFDEISEGSVIPEYTFIFQKQNDGTITRQTKRI